MDSSCVQTGERGLGALERWRKRHKKTIDEMCADVLRGEIHRATYYRWFAGSKPRREHCALVLQILHIDISPRSRRR